MAGANTLRRWGAACPPKNIRHEDAMDTINPLFTATATSTGGRNGLNVVGS